MFHLSNWGGGETTSTQKTILHLNKFISVHFTFCFASGDKDDF